VVSCWQLEPIPLCAEPACAPHRPPSHFDLGRHSFIANLAISVQIAPLEPLRNSGQTLHVAGPCVSQGRGSA
jgi:hypothetical protein